MGSALYAAPVMDDHPTPSSDRSRDEESSTIESNSELSLTPSRVDEPALEGELVRRSAGGLLPALRADLAPLVPPIRRAATVVAIAALTDWALRSGSRRLLREGIGRLSREAAPTTIPRPASATVVRSETVIVERLIIHRSG